MFGILAVLAGWAAVTPSSVQAQQATEPTQSASAASNPNKRMFWKNPYSGNMTDEEVASSSKANPPILDAKWEHEACTIAHSYKASEPDFRRNLERDRLKAEGDITAFLANGGDQATADKARAEVKSAVENELADYQSMLNNIPKCKGTFFRPAAQEFCKEWEGRNTAAPANPFCVAARGGALEGVSFSDDKLAMGQSVAWHSLGLSPSRPHGFMETDWFTIGKKEYREPELDPVLQPGSIFLADNSLIESAYEKTSEAKEDAIQAALESEYRIVMRGAKATDIATEKTISYLGGWNFSLEMIRVKKSDLAPGTLEQIQGLGAASGIPWDLGEYAQYPRLHFQANIPDVLVQSEAVWFQIESERGNRALEAVAPFELAADGAPTMMSSYQSKRVHAASIPTPADWQALRDPATITLVATTFITLEDGSIDQVNIPVSWRGFQQALANLAGAQNTVVARTIAATNKWDTRLADLRKRANWYQASLQRVDAEARALVAARKPLNFNCSSFPSTYGDGANINRLADERIACQTHWSTEVYFPYWKKLQSLRGPLATGGFTQTLEAVNREIERWQSRQVANREELQNFNLDVEARNKRIREAPPQQARRSSTTSTPQTRYSDAWQRGQQRRRSSGPERDYAAEFFESQRNPPPLMQYPPVPTRRPPSYFRPGYN